MNRIEYSSMPPVLELVKKKGFVVFEDGDFDLNIIGLRNLSNRESNLFDDEIHIVYKMGDIWIDEFCACTTDPGAYWLQKEDYKPCAIYYHDQQARGAYQIGLHRGKPALRQIKPVKFWRDGNKDLHLDFQGPVFEDIIYVNIHRAGMSPEGSHFVDKWSAGCIVLKLSRDMDRLLELAQLQVDCLGYKTFSFCLLGVKNGSEYNT
jgi:hypothetical protein